MEAYIEYVILDNFTIDLLILLIVINILRFKVKKGRILLSASLGTAGAVVMPIIPLAAAIAVRIILAPLMILILRKYKSLKEYILTLLIMLAVTFGAGGAVMAIFNMSVSDNYMFINYPQGGIVGLSALGIIIIFYAVKQLSLFTRVIPQGRELYDVTVKIGDDLIKMKAFYDSGNSLYDNDYKPVLIIGNQYSECIVKGCKAGENITLSTVNGRKETKSYIIEKVLIYICGQVNTIYNISTVISETSFNHYDLLLGRDILKEGF